MALAEPALRQFGLQRLQNLRFRGGGLLGTAIGTAIGIGFGIAANYDVGLPFDNVLQPDRTKRGIPTLDGSQKNASTYQQYQAFRRKNKYRHRFRSSRKSRDSNCCCCTCISRNKRSVRR